jgi:kynurenine 3-monooxygenase
MDQEVCQVRDRALGRFERLNFSRHFIRHGYKELSMPPAADGGFAMYPNALHIWPRGEFMLIALPNGDKTFTCTLFMPFADLDKLTKPAEVSAFFDQHFPDVTAQYGNLMPGFAEEFFTNPSSPLVSIKCDPWHHTDKLLILGDAAHATVPFYGQGMNAAFEDALYTPPATTLPRSLLVR